MLKHILLLTLLTFTFAKRHAQPEPNGPPPEDEPPFPAPPGEGPPGEDDPFVQCLKEHCGPETEACFED